MPRGIPARYAGLFSQGPRSTSMQANPSCLGSPIVCRLLRSNNLVEFGDGRVRGSHLLQLWKDPPLEPEAIHDLLQVPDDIATPRGLRLIALFREWYACPLIISRLSNGFIKTISLQLAVS